MARLGLDTNIWLAIFLVGMTVLGKGLANPQEFRRRDFVLGPELAVMACGLRFNALLVATKPPGPDSVLVLVLYIVAMLAIFLWLRFLGYEEAPFSSLDRKPRPRIVMGILIPGAVGIGMLLANGLPS